MVAVTISPVRGNHNKFFPYSGHLGLSPIVIQGSIKTTLEEDRKPVKARSLCVRVRCYEIEIRPTRKSKCKTQVLYEQEIEVWNSDSSREAGSSNDEAVYAALGEFAAPFRMEVPLINTGVGNCIFQNYKAWWQIEGVIKHKPSNLYGSQRVAAHQLDILHYPSPLDSPLPPVTWNSALTPDAVRGLQYSFTMPTAGLLQKDRIDFSVHLRRDDPRLQIRKVQFVLERHTTVDSSMASLSTSDSDSDDAELTPPEFDEASLGGHSEDFLISNPGRPASRSFTSVFKRASSASSNSRVASRSSGNISPMPSPLYGLQSAETLSYFGSPPSPVDARHPVASTEVNVPKGKWSHTLKALTVDLENPSLDVECTATGILPGENSFWRYSLGQSMRTKICHIFYTITPKIHVKGLTGSTQVIVLPKQIVQMAACSAEQLRDALAREQTRRPVPSIAISGNSRGSSSASSSRATSRSSNPQQLPTPPLQQTATLASRRSRDFRLSIETTRSAPVTSKGSSRSGEEPRSVVRRRSEQSDGASAPVKSKARVSNPFPANEPPTPESPNFGPMETPRPAKVSEGVSSTTPRHGFFPLATPPPMLSPVPANGHSPSPPLSHSAPRSTRRSARSPGPYSGTMRPRSAGQISARSTTASISALSITSANSRPSREQSAPLPETSSSMILSPEHYAEFSKSNHRLHELASLSELERSSSVSPLPGLESAMLSRSNSSTGDEMTPPPLPPAIDFNSFSLVADDVSMQTLPSTSVDSKTRQAIAPWTVDISPLEQRLPVVPSGMLRAASDNGLKVAGLHPIHVALSENSPPPPPPRRKSSVGFGLFGKLSSEDGDGEKESSGRWGFLRRGSKV